MIKYFTKLLSSDPQVSSVDLEEYSGESYELSDGNGNILSKTDTRDIFAFKAEKLKDFKERAFEEVILEAPVLDQINAAAGRLSGEETTAINNTISGIRSKYQVKKQAVLGALTLDEVDAIQWED